MSNCFSKTPLGSRHRNKHRSRAQRGDLVEGNGLRESPGCYPPDCHYGFHPSCRSYSSLDPQKEVCCPGDNRPGSRKGPEVVSLGWENVPLVTNGPFWGGWANAQAPTKMVWKRERSGEFRLTHCRKRLRVRYNFKWRVSCWA